MDRPSPDALLAAAVEISKYQHAHQKNQVILRLSMGVIGIFDNLCRNLDEIDRLDKWLLSEEAERATEEVDRIRGMVSGHNVSALRRAIAEGSIGRRFSMLSEPELADINGLGNNEARGIAEALRSTQ